MISTSALQQFLKHAAPDCVVSGTDLFSLRLSIKNNDTANTARDIQCEWNKIVPFFGQIGKKNIFWSATDFE